MSRIIKFTKRSYVFIILALFYIPLAIGVMYSFQVNQRKGDIPYVFKFSGQGWTDLVEDKELSVAIINSFIVGITVALIVTAISLLTVYGIWRSKSRVSKAYVNTTSNIPLINPDIITGISLGLAFTLMFGILQRGDNGAERVIIGQATMILPFGITIMYPRSEKFRISIMEASKDLGYGPIRTWFKTYFRYMIGISLIVFLIALAMSFDDFIIVKTVSKETTIGRKMYKGALRPWILALGTIVLGITLSASALYTTVIFIKERRKK